MLKKTFSFCGVSLQLQSEKVIENSNFFYKFLTDDAPDITVKVISSRLPERKGKLIFENRVNQWYIYEGREYRFSSYFIGKTNSYKDYAVRVCDGEAITLYIDYPDGMWDSMVFGALDLPEILIKRNILILHSSFIIHEGRAILFSGDKCVGKSTQAALWENYRGATIVNGDRAAVYFDENGTAYAEAIPYCGSSKVCLNRKAPIGAIVLLNQAKSNFTKNIDEFTAFTELLGKLTYNEWNISHLEKAVDNAKRLIESVPVFKLYCLPDEEAVITLENCLKAEKGT